MGLQLLVLAVTWARGPARGGLRQLLELEIDAYLPGECPDDGEPCGPGLYSQTLVLGGSPPWRVEDGFVEEYGIPVTMNGEDVVVQVHALDPCGREGWTQHRW